METRLIILKYLTALSILISLAGMAMPLLREAASRLAGWL